VSHSGELAVKIDGLMDHYTMNGGTSLHASADYILKRVENGLCATSDSAIIANSKVRVLDLARQTLVFHFNPIFTDLSQVFK
jgi:hypothetical protein